MSEWELREHWEREEEPEAEADEFSAVEKLGVGGQLPPFLPMPAFMATAHEE